MIAFFKPRIGNRAVALLGLSVLLVSIVVLTVFFRKTPSELIYNEIPIPFVSANGTDYLTGNVSYFGKRNGIDVYEVTFNAGEANERMYPDRIYLVHIPNSPEMRDVPLDVAMEPIAGGSDMDYYGYRYSDTAATIERRDINALRFKDRFPAQFFASDSARRNDINMNKALAAFEQANDVLFLRTDNTAGAVRLDPAGALYVFVVNEVDGAILEPREDPTNTWCGDGIVQPATEECDDGNTDAGPACHNDCTVGFPIPFGGTGSSAGAELAVSVRNITSPSQPTARPGDKALTLMKLVLSTHDEEVVVTDFVFKALAGSVAALTNYRLWEDSDSDGAVDRIVSQPATLISGKAIFAVPDNLTGAVIGNGETVLYELRADVPLEIADERFQIAFDTDDESYIGGRRQAGSFPLVGIETDGVCVAEPFCTIIATLHDGISWTFLSGPLCGNGVAETGEQCNEPGLSCGTDQTCNTNTCACEVSPPQSSASSAGNQSNCGNGVLEPPDEECDFMDPDIPQGECDETCHLITPVPDF